MESLYNKVYFCIYDLLFLFPSLLEKKSPKQVFFCKYCEIFNNTCFEEHLRTAAPVFNDQKIKETVHFSLRLFRDLT